MEMSPENDDKPATQGIVRAAIEDATRKLSQMIQSAFQPLIEKITRLEEKMDAHHRDTIGTIQAFAGKIESYERETYTIRAPLDEHGKQLANHEQRIATLEAKPSELR